ncbi:hypothetical protein PIB30_015624 [Stylosanthes scabra]|uniref:Oxidative stress 3 n=1 Tax=Stylosanthes scabra TaxID=79078 RepID=A0ABU6S7N0_9FABA|nr:hypothetical protein [Stylosanthes scabra]
MMIMENNNRAKEMFMEMNGNNNVKGKIMDDDDNCECRRSDSSSSTSIGSISEDTMGSLCSSYSSSELAEDASSSSSSSSSSHSKIGPLYELSELMDHLPIKRGLSMFYKGKAQSFTSLARVQSIEDLPKKGINTSYSKRMKSCKSYAGGLDLDTHNKISFSPKPTISKKTTSSSSTIRGSFLSLQSKKGSFLGGSRVPISVHKNF